MNELAKQLEITHHDLTLEKYNEYMLLYNSLTSLVLRRCLEDFILFLYTEAILESSTYYSCKKKHFILNSQRINPNETLFRIG